MDIHGHHFACFFWLKHLFLIFPHSVCICLLVCVASCVLLRGDS